MTEPIHKIGEMVEDAVYGYLAGLLAAPLYRTADQLETGERVLYPHIAINAVSVAQEFPDAPSDDQAAGNRIVTVECAVKTTAKTEKVGGVPIEVARAQHSSRLGSLDDAIFVTDLEAQLNAQSVTGLYVTLVETGDITTSTDGNRLVSVLPLMVHCCAVG